MGRIEALMQLEKRCKTLRENAHRAGKEGPGTHRNAGDGGRVAALWMEACRERDALRAQITEGRQMTKWTLPEGKIYTQADLDAAVAAERERCAKVAERMSEYWEDEWRKSFRGDSYLEGKSDGAADVAAAIRKGDTP